MNKEYQKNQSKQKSLFKKYRKSMRNMLIGGIVGISSFFLFPYLGLADILGATPYVLSRIGITAIGAISSLYNGVKAHYISKSLKNEMDYEEGLIESMELSSSKKDEKIDELEKSLSNEKQKNNVNSNENVISKKKDYTISSYDEDKDIVKIKTR